MKRSDRSLLTNWWFQIDLWIMGLVAALCFVGVLSGISTPSLLDKTILFYAMAGAVLFWVPMWGRERTINVAWGILAACAILLAISYLSPHVVHNSRRWAIIAGFSIMPADLLKPAFVVLTAWFLSAVKRRAPDDLIGAKSVRIWWVCYAATFLSVLACMFFHPDLGNMFMYMMVFCAMIYWVGAKWRYLGAMAAIGAAGIALSFLYPHFRTRVFGEGDNWQVARSLDAIRNGGLWGRGEESFLFEKVPMANNDFVFAGIAEMWGCVMCAVLLAAMFWMFALLFKRSIDAKDDLSSLMIFGASMFFVLHIFMNVLTAMGLFMKGTTLPFISYGGSSLIGFALMFAFALGAIRRDKWGR